MLWIPLYKFEAYINDGDVDFKEHLSQINFKCAVLEKLYPYDLNSEELFSNLKDIILLFKREKVNREQKDFTHQRLLQYISSMKLEAYKTLATALKIFLTLPVPISSYERSCIKLKLVKSYLQSTIFQDRVSTVSYTHLDVYKRQVCM